MYASRVAARVAFAPLCIALFAASDLAPCRAQQAENPYRATPEDVKRKFRELLDAQKTPIRTVDAAHARSPASLTPPTRLYELEQEITFNVLDYVVLGPEDGQITLIGHRDSRFAGPRIPYLQHLATLLEYPRPEFSLEWTPESERRVDQLLRRMDSDAELEKVLAKWTEALDANERVTTAGRWLLPLVGVRPTPGGTWDTLERHEIAAQMLTAVGKPDAATIMRSFVAIGKATKRGTPESEVQDHLRAVLTATDAWPAVQEAQQQVAAGVWSEQEALAKWMRVIVVGVDEAFELARAPLTAVFDQCMNRGMGPEAAFDAATVGELNRQLGPVGAQAMTTLINRHDQIIVPPHLMGLTVGTQLEVAPKYLDVDGHSQLARAMFEADYAAKYFINTPELADAIPGYETEFLFSQKRPGRSTSGPRTASHRLWISVGKLDLAQSPDGNTLQTRGATMRINTRELDARGRSLPGTMGDYEKMLTGLYDELAGEFPVLHEVREAGKLAAAAQWINAREPGTKLPRQGHESWQDDGKMPGAVYFAWFPNAQRGQVVAAMSAVGGVSLVSPGPARITDAIPTDSSVVVLPEGDLTVTPQVYKNETLSRMLRRKVEVPVPRPVGWVTRATKGKRTLEALSVISTASAQETADSLALRHKLEQARAIASQLALTERAINAITQQNPNRQADFAQMEAQLEQAHDEFIQSSIDIVSQGLLDAHSLLRDKYVYRRTGFLGDVANSMVDAKEALDAVQGKLTNIQTQLDRARTLAGEDREQAIQALVDLQKELIEAADLSGTGPLATALRPLQKTVNFVGKVEAAIGVVRPFVVLESARRRIKTLDAQTDAELASLRDDLLPLQRQLSDQLDEVLKDPAISKLIAAPK
ncbi:MAG: hypothetical protein PVH68_18650 [Armatimonadota bacterium]|jgi:hypothetical protein